MKIKESLFPPSLFAIYFGVLLLMAGIHAGLLVFMNTAGWSNLVQTVIPMVYWGMVAAGLTLFTRKKIKNTYEEPLHKMAEATRKVSEEDFSVYGKGEDFFSGNVCTYTRHHWDGIYGRLCFCSDHTAALLYSVHTACCARISGMDISLFSL